MKFTALATLVFSFALSSITQAANWREGLGQYRSISGTIQKSLTLQAYSESELVLLVYGPGWSNDAKTTKLKYTCSGARCYCTNPDFESASLTFLNDGQIVMEELGWESVYFQKINQDNSPPASAWTFKEYADSNQILYTASQSDKASGATLVASCRARSEQVNWAIRLSEKSYLTVQGAVLYAKAELKADRKVDNLKSQTSQWSVADNRYITAKQSTPFNLAELKNGSQVSMTLIAVKPDGTEVSLDKMTFSLKGSTTALNKLQQSCNPNSNSDLPIPLP
jgi:hypothetical protein